jgi:recombination protein RecT
MSNELTFQSFDPAARRMQELGMDLVQIKKEVSFALQHISRNAKLKDCTVESKIASVINIANIGLTLNPVSKEAYLIPRYSRVINGMECTLEPSYVGLVKLLTDAGSVKSMVANVVYGNDKFEIDLADNQTPVRHKPELTHSKRGVVLGCYALATLPDGTRQVEWMDLEQLYLIRDRSETYAAYKEGKIKSCTWVSDETEMIRKTLVKRIFKYLPRTERMEQIDNAIHVDNVDYMATDGQIDLIESLLRTSTLEERQRSAIELEVSVMNSQRASQVIEMLQKNQLDPVTQRGTASQGEINKHMKEKVA